MPFIFSCSEFNSPNEVDNNSINVEMREESLRKIYQLDSKYNWEYANNNYYRATGKNFDYGYTSQDFAQSLQDENVDIGILRAGVKRLVSKSNEELLINFLKNNEDYIVQLNSAVALAYLGNPIGLEIIKECAKGNLVLSSSGNERHHASLGLLLLNEKLPDEYKNWSMADKYYLLVN